MANKQGVDKILDLFLQYRKNPHMSIHEEEALFAQAFTIMRANNLSLKDLEVKYLPGQDAKMLEDPIIKRVAEKIFEQDYTSKN